MARIQVQQEPRTLQLPILRLPDQIPGSASVHSGNPANLTAGEKGARVRLMNQEGDLTAEGSGTRDPPSSGRSPSGAERRRAASPRRAVHCGPAEACPDPAQTSHVTTAQVPPAGAFSKPAWPIVSELRPIRPSAPRGGDGAGSQLSTPRSLPGAGAGSTAVREAECPAPAPPLGGVRSDWGRVPAFSIRRTSLAALQSRKPRLIGSLAGPRTEPRLYHLLPAQRLCEGELLLLRPHLPYGGVGLDPSLQRCPPPDGVESAGSGGDNLGFRPELFLLFAVRS